MLSEERVERLPHEAETSHDRVDCFSKVLEHADLVVKFHPPSVPFCRSPAPFTQPNRVASQLSPLEEPHVDLVIISWQRTRVQGVS